MKRVSLKVMAFFLLALAQSALALTFYFLPPYDAEWMRKYPRVIDVETGIVTPMKISKEHCGWYELDITGDALNNPLLIWQGHVVVGSDEYFKGAADRMGLFGLEDDPSEWKGIPAVPEDENLIIFNKNVPVQGGKVYFDPSKGKGGWKNEVPNYDVSKYCRYKMAGLIYDTDKGVMGGSFTRYEDSKEAKYVGIVRGIVHPTLRKNAQGIPKMQWSGEVEVQKTGNWSQTDFNNAFECKKGINALVCYDMPFNKDGKGLWTFSSDFLCDDGTLDLRDSPDNFFTEGNADRVAKSLCKSPAKPTLSFAPDRLNGDMRGVEDNLGECTYAACTDCKKTYDAEPATPFKTGSIEPACYEKGIKGTNANNCGSSLLSEERHDDFAGPLGDGKLPEIWEWTTRDNIKKYMARKELNSFFCFESHATFIYEKGQEFYFSGDDDIWVFIDNNLVIDLGGTHLAAPGYVALDSIGKGRWANPTAVSGKGPTTPYKALEEGKEYPIDIFFCDRRTNASNIRVSTNMFILQEVGILMKGDPYIKNKPADLCVRQSGAGNCAALVGGGGSSDQTLCDSKVNCVFGFYIENRAGDPESRDTLRLKKSDGTDHSNCVANPDSKRITCYGGITVDMGAGKVTIDEGIVRNLGGSWNVFAYVKPEAEQRSCGNNNPVKPDGIDPYKVGKVTVKGAVRTAWGTIKDGVSPGTPDLLKDLCKQITHAPAGQLVPICFSVGGQAGNTFTTDGTPAEIGGANVRLNTNPSNINNDKGLPFQVYYDSTGGGLSENEAKLGETFVIPGGNTYRPRGQSVPGVLVLWVKGNYKQDEMYFDYKINTSNGKSDAEVTVRTYAPQLEWVKADSTFTTPIPKSNQIGSVWKNGNPLEGTVPGTDGKDSAAWMGDQIVFQIRAYWTEDNGTTKKDCPTCNFDLSLESGAYKYPEAPGAPQPPSGEPLDYRFPDFAVKNGKADFWIAGKRQIKDPIFARMEVTGPSIKQQSASWDKLQFAKPPVPIPEKTMIFDRDGDGIGDSLVIVYDRGFKKDSLPNMVEVLWDKDSTYRFGIAPLSANKQYQAVPGNEGNNYNYWKDRWHLSKINPALATVDSRVNSLSETELQFFAQDTIRDTLILFLDSAGTGPAAFSIDVLTKGNGGTQVKSWASFKVGNAAPSHLPFTQRIEDKIPAIVAYARYDANSDKGCNARPGCQDIITLQLSEPVKPDGSPDKTAARNAFAYMLRDVDPDTLWRILDPDKHLPTTIIWGNTTSELPSQTGDSIVKLYYSRWRAENDVSWTPMPGDSVKFASVEGTYPGFATNIFVDANGNRPNKNEWGRQIEGKKPFAPEKIPLGEVNPDNPDYAKDKAKDKLHEIGSNADDKQLDNLFSKGDNVELLPALPEWGTGKIIQGHYPGTVGVVFNPDVFNDVSALEKENGDKILDSDITFFIRVFYHTNLGNYVADRTFQVKCSDAIFPGGSCRNSKSKLYIAWDMKDSKGRFVGTGAYVGLYDFRWEAYLSRKGETRKMESIERKVEMHGVKRTKKGPGM